MNFNRFFQAFRGENDRGVAIVEFSFVLPLFLLFIFGTIDIARALHNYALLREAAQEGLLFATREVGLEVGVFQGLTTGQNCRVRAVAPAPGHTGVQRRVAQVIRSQSLALAEGSLCIQTERIKAPTSGMEQALVNTVQVEVRGEFEGIFPWFDGLQFQISLRGPFVA